MDPTAFERLCQRILRESDFIEVNVTQDNRATAELMGMG